MPAKQTEQHACCGASRPNEEGAHSHGVAVESVARVSASIQGATAKGMILLDGGKFLMGSSDNVGFPADGEGPVRDIALKPFYIDPHTVTNERFAAFVDATGYMTDAERFGWSFVYAGFLPDDFPETRGVAQTP